jgi:hypothetical protein
VNFGILGNYFSQENKGSVLALHPLSSGLKTHQKQKKRNQMKDPQTTPDQNFSQGFPSGLHSLTLTLAKDQVC